MIGAIIGGIGELVVDLTVEDEKAKAAAKIAVWLGAGTLGVLDGGVSSVASGMAAAAAATKVATQGVGLALPEGAAKSVVDTVGSVAADGMTSWVGLAKTGVGATVGGTAGGAAGGVDGLVSGMSKGAALASGSGAETLAKLGGGVVGASVAVAAADDADRRRAVEMGISVGMAVGGGAAAAGSSSAMVVENAELRGAPAPVDEALTAQVREARRQGVVRLGAEVAAPLLAAAVHRDERDRSQDFLTTWGAMRGVASSLSGVVRTSVDVSAGGVDRDAALALVGDGAAGVGSLVLHVVDRQARQRASRERQDEVAEAASRRRVAIELVSEVTGLPAAWDRWRAKKA